TCRCSTETERLLLALTDDGDALVERNGCEQYESSRTDPVRPWTPGKRGRRDLTLEPMGSCIVVASPQETFTSTGWVKTRGRSLAGVQRQTWTGDARYTASSVTRFVGKPHDGTPLPTADPRDGCAEMWLCIYARGGR